MYYAVFSLTPIRRKYGIENLPTLLLSLLDSPLLTSWRGKLIQGVGVPKRHTEDPGADLSPFR